MHTNSFKKICLLNSRAVNAKCPFSMMGGSDRLVMVLVDIGYDLGVLLCTF